MDTTITLKASPAEFQVIKAALATEVTYQASISVDRTVPSWERQQARVAAEAAKKLRDSL
jgi:hypothetical protein